MPQGPHKRLPGRWWETAEGAIQKKPRFRGASTLADQGFPHLRFAPCGMNFSPVIQQKAPLSRGFSPLADQGSNLDSSEPKSDVLPVTPSANTAPKDGSCHLESAANLERSTIRPQEKEVEHATFGTFAAYRSQRPP